MIKQPRSTAEYGLHPIDCRLLSLNLDFYELSSNQMAAMANDIVSWMETLLAENFVIRRSVDNRTIGANKVIPNIRSALQSEKYVSYILEAMVTCPTVHSVATFRKYFRDLRDMMCLSKEATHSVLTSVDYSDYWYSLFPEIENDDAVIREKVLRIFRQEGKKMLGCYTLPDVQALLSCMPYEFKKNLYHGSFGIDISAFCLNSDLDETAKSLADFALYLTGTYVNLNAHVQLQPDTGSPYTRIFGRPIKQDESCKPADCLYREWYPTYYLSGVEWLNILSPLTQQHFDSCPCTDVPADIASYRTSSGNLIVQSTKDISKYDISDALKLKKVLYPALPPGTRTISYRTLFYDKMAAEDMVNFPRNRWEVVPVFEDELFVVGRCVVYSSKC